MTKTKDPRREKINDLKSAIVTARDELMTLIATTVTQEEAKSEQHKQVMVKKVLIQNMQTELKLVRMNRLSSKFFEWNPTPPNRSQARHFRRNRNARNIPPNK